VWVYLSIPTPKGSASILFASLSTQVLLLPGFHMFEFVFYHRIVLFCCMCWKQGYFAPLSFVWAPLSWRFFSLSVLLTTCLLNFLLSPVHSSKKDRHHHLERQSFGWSQHLGTSVGSQEPIFLFMIVLILKTLLTPKGFFHVFKIQPVWLLLFMTTGMV